MKKSLIIMLVLFLLLVGLFGWQMYLRFHPDAELRVLQPVDSESDMYITHFTYSLNKSGWLPYASKFDTESRIFIDQTGEKALKIGQEYVAPTHVEASVKKEDGKTVVTYTGNVTTQEGTNIDYRDEIIFDFELYYKE